MVSFPLEVEILIKPSGFYTSRKLSLIEALAHGLSNKAIAEELDLTVKSVERILNQLNDKLGNKAGSEFKDLGKVFNPRLRLMAGLISSKIIELKPEIAMRHIEGLDTNLKRTLILTCIGFANKTIAEVFGLSDKAIELRLTNLFDYFAVDTKSQQVENPRCNLFISAYARGNISKQQLARLYRETRFSRLDAILTKPDSFLAGLEDDYKMVG
ncbi:MAG: LuxR C-terminal-related transcriptional regulator [Candidatus Melainabacteria bacterium]|nr:LuxR C-terminal-related transcriptional regulator [Candidatus Melainabacteria bacterium]